jgi:2-haloacid dehalogenase
MQVLAAMFGISMQLCIKQSAPDDSIRRQPMSDSHAPSRRTLLVGSTAAATGFLIPGLQAFGQSPKRVKAVAFDAFPVFDPRPIFALADQLYPGKGNVLGDAWRTRQFEYCWLRALAGDYADFWQVTADALAFSVTRLDLNPDPKKQADLMQAYLNLGTWPEVPNALETLKKHGLKTAFLSNFTPAMLRANMKKSKIEKLFDHVLSTDAVRSYKPDPRAYQQGVEAFGVSRDEIAFVAFAGWDAAGAKSFGYPTFWNNRLKLPPEQLGHTVDGSGAQLTDLLKFLRL